jgi:hypothetical protein
MTGITRIFILLKEPAVFLISRASTEQFLMTLVLAKIP